MRTDLLYLLSVQVALPAALAVAVTSKGSELVHSAAPAVTGLWPHAAPAVLQLVLMLLLADLLRYGLHVAAHRFEPLWRLHAVHHSPAKLYWLNVGRFHPAEKVLQYALDAVPFALVGVGPDVLALYFVFYALNGFFQHSNVSVRLGLLNWVVSGPELHRWHHSRRSRESNANYGNNLIVWDVLFGTRLLPDPARAEVGAIGLPNPRYPTRFVDQLKAPFVAGVERTDTPLPSWRELGTRLLIRARMAILGVAVWRPFVAAAKRPRETQLAVLRRIVASNRDSKFGRDHDFGGIRDLKDFRRSVPVQTWESLRPWVDAQARTGEPVLTRARPVLYAQTSGTTGEPKRIPITREGLAEQRRSQNLAACVQYRAIPAAFEGRILGIASPAIEGTLESGVPFGSASGQIHSQMPRIARSRYVVPPEVFEPADYDLEYQLILRLAVVCKDITAMGSANPSTFLALFRLLCEKRLEILSEVESDGFARWDELPPNVQQAVSPRLACTTERLSELRSILAAERPKVADLWPRLALLTTWTGGSCGIALDAVRRSLPTSTRVAELGYLASELRGTVPVDPDTGRCVPTLRDTFFEFVERGRWERDPFGRETLEGLQMLDELEHGAEYYVIATTTSGLYRYFMNDVVRVTGRFHATPTLEFVQKGRGVTNITGEKLSEAQVIEAVRGAAGHDLELPFFLVLADEACARYELLVEASGATPPQADALADTVDARLCRLNVEYAQKRSSGRLLPLHARLLREGAGEAYRRHCVARGQRQAQFKAQLLQYARELDFPTRSWRRESGDCDSPTSDGKPHEGVSCS